MRTRAVRDVFTSVFDGFLGSFSQTLENPDVLFNHLSGQTGQLGVRLKKEMINHLGGVPTDLDSGEPMSREIDAVGRMITYSVSEHFSIELAKRFREVGNLFDDLFKGGQFDIQDAHNEALEMMLDDKKERQDLTNLIWEVKVRNTGSPWILPDCAVMNVSTAGNVTPFLFGGQDTRAAIIMPLSPDRILIGVTTGSDMINVENLDEHAARCSSEFFITSERSSRLDEICEYIGQGAQKELDEGLTATLSAIDPFLTKPKDKDYSHSSIKDLTISGYGFNVTEADFTLVAKALGNMIISASRQLHLDQIRQVFVCPSVPQAVLERRGVDIEALGKLGFEGSFYKLPIEDEDGIGFELYVNGYALGIILNYENDDHDFFMNLFLQTLWQVHTRAILFAEVSNFAGINEIYKTDGVSARLSELALSAAIKYVAARHASFIEDLSNETRDVMRDEFVQGLTNWLNADLPLHGDEEERSTKCEMLVRANEDLFISAVRYLGVCQAQNIDAVEDLKSSDEAISLIEANSLFDWIHRLDVDLRILFANFDKHFEREKVLSLTAHIERLYWGRGVIVVIEGEGSRVLPFSDRSVNYAKLHEEVGKFAAEFIPNDLKKIIQNSTLDALSESKK